MTCDTCREASSCTTLCDDMESILPKEMRFEEIPFGGSNEMENIVQKYIDESDAPTIKRDINPELFKVGIALLNKLPVKQHLILYMYHVAGLNDWKISFFFNMSRSKVNYTRRMAYKKLQEMQK